jgi:hypothetical protein
MPKTDAVDGRAESIRQLRNMMTGLLRQKKGHPVQQYDRIFRNLLRYIRLHLTRLARYETMPLDYLALTTRTLIEVAILAEFITSGKDQIDHYFDEVEFDMFELSKLIPPNELPKSASNLKPGKHSDLEKKRQSDKFWFKLCSKIIHPTAWSINIAMKPRSQFASTRRNDLAAYGLRSAMRAFATLTGLCVPSYIND